MVVTRHVRIFPALLWLLAFGGCGSDIELTVDVRTDFRPADEFVTVQTELSDSRFGDVPTGSDAVNTAASALDDYLRGQRVAEYGVIEPGRHFVRVTLSDRHGAPIARQGVDLEVHEDFALTVVLTRNCGEVSCPQAGDPTGYLSCVDATCVDPRCTPSTPEYCDRPTCDVNSDCTGSGSCSAFRCIDRTCFCTAIPADSGPPDAGPVDGGPPCAASETSCVDGVDEDCDGATDCADSDCADVACDDGDACTSADRCLAGACVGTARSCDDSNACTVDACDAASGCTHMAAANGSMCGAGAGWRCCGGACRNTWTDEGHCSGCGLACSAGLTCSAVASGPGASCRGCSYNSECRPNTGSPVATCWPVSMGGNDRCQCQANAHCAAGQRCYTGTGDNYCYYP